jgi:large subunit ribosomal protein L17
MRHHNSNRKFGRPSRGRLALLRGLARSLVLDEKMTTTLARAKELRPFVEKLVTMSRKNTIASRRLVSARLGGSVESTEKLHRVLFGRFTGRAGGYTRIIKLPRRKSDGAEQAIIEFV